MIDRRTLLVSGGAAAAALASPAGAVTPLGRDDIVLGSPRAPVTVIEYASASCPHCARWSMEVFPEFQRRFIRTGQVRYALREFLTAPPELAAAGFLLARCRGPSRYYDILQAVFAAQAEVYRTQDIQGPLMAVAARFGIDQRGFNACLSNRAGLRAMNARITRYVRNDGVDSTPTFFVNQTKLVGEQTLDDLAAAIAAAQRPRG